MKKRKITLIGCGAVGNSFIYSSINQGLAEEYILIDQFVELAEGNALDFSDAVIASQHSSVNVRVGDYHDLIDTDILVISAGRAQKLNETRLDMVIDNAQIMKEIALKVKNSGFSGITVIAANPVDIMTSVYQKVTKFDFHKVIGSGTLLDTFRLKLLISQKLKISPEAISVYVLGEHGDSSMIPWNSAVIAGKTVEQQINAGKLTKADLKQFEKMVINRAYQIINLKKATYYGIGQAITSLIKAILHGQNMIFTIGAYLEGQYENTGFYCGVPSVVNEKGWVEIVNLVLSKTEQKKFNHSCQILKKTLDFTCQKLNLN